jgi:Zn-dependent metalloprotease
MAIRDSARLRVPWVFLLGLLALLAAARLNAQPRDRVDALARLTTSLRVASPGRAGGAGEPARSAWNANGALRYLGAPPETSFPTPTPGEPETAALGFLRAHRDLLGVGDAVDFVLERRRARPGHASLRFRQTSSGVPVFAAQVVVQTDDSGGIVAVIADLATAGGVRALDRVSVRPAVTASEATARAESLAHARVPDAAIEARASELVVFAPEVIGDDGAPTLAWDVVVGARGRPGSSFRVLIAAGDGEVIRAFPLDANALDRVISDSNNTTHFGSTVRTEGQPPCGIVEADHAYDYLGDTYAFYLLNHGRDGLPNFSQTLRATVRYCDQPVPCPWSNAYYSSIFNEMFFGDGWAVDDVVAHEYTHGVTANESQLIYANASGALNESMSDVWGEFVDLSNGHGNDAAGVRWQHGEDLPGGANRDMKNPPAHGQPDRRWSPLYVPAVTNPDDSNDQGGVHTNSGVNNKLCFLLTDGGTFNGQTVTGLGISRIADLYYEVNTDLLTPGADWDELFDALRQAAVNLGWNANDRANLERGCLAVEIASYVVDRTSVCTPTGAPACGSLGGPFPTVAAANSAVAPGATLTIRAGTYPEALSLTRRGRFVAEGGAARVGP